MNKYDNELISSAKFGFK